MPEKFIIKKVTVEDMMKVFELSNDPLVRQNSINQAVITLEAHKNWFLNQLQQNAAPFYIIETESKEFIAQVRFSNNEENIISISIAEPFRGKGFATNIIKKCSKKSGLNPIFAYIKKENEASLKSFQKAGYAVISEPIINNTNFWKLQYFS